MDGTQKQSFRQQIVALLDLKGEGEYSAADVVSDLCELVEGGGPKTPKTSAVRIRHQLDADPNVSWLGEYTDAIPGGMADSQVVDREEKDDLRGGEAGGQIAEPQRILSALAAASTLPPLDEVEVVERF